MFGLTTLGIIHTAISLIAVLSGAIALISNKKISGANAIGKIYIVTTILTCLTAFGIYQHGGFGPGHVLAIITLVVLILAMAAGDGKRLGSSSLYISTVAFSFTFFLHLVPGISETATRLPVGAPMATGPDDPHLKLALGICFLLFLLGATAQVVALRRQFRKNA